MNGNHNCWWGPFFPRLRFAVLIWLAWVNSAHAQFDELPAPPLPPPAFEATPVEDDDESETSLSSRLRAFDEAVRLLSRRDEEAADKLRRDLDSILQQYVKRAQAGNGRQQQAERPASKFVTPQPRFDAASAAIARLRKDGDTGAADRMAARLKRLRSNLNAGKITQPASDPKSPDRNDQLSGAEIHHVHLNRGLTLPKEFRTAENRYSTGYAKVIVRHTARPVILCLSSRDPMLWQVEVDENVELAAVILDSLRDQKVTGIGNTLVLETRKAVTDGLVQNSDSRHWQGRHGLLYRLAGGRPATHFSDDAWSGKPIEIGPGNRAWLAASYVPEVATMESEANGALRARQAARLGDLRFRAPFRATIDQSSGTETCMGEFTVHGPQASSLVPLPHRMLRQSVPVGDATFGLTIASKLVTVQHREEGSELTPVPLSKDFPSNRFQALTFDSQRNRLVAAVQGQGGSTLVAFDIVTGTWSRLTQLSSTLVGIEHVAENDQLWAVGATWSSNGGEEVLFLQLKPTGEPVSERVISPKLETAESNGRRRQLRSGQMQLIESDGRAVLVGTLPSVGSPKPTCSLYVVHPATAELLYSNTLTVQHKTGPSGTTEDGKTIAGSALSSFNSRLSSVTRRVDELRRAAVNDGGLGMVDAVAAEERLNAVRNLFLGRPDRSSTPRMYVVGRYMSKEPARVRVTDTSAPVILALCGQQSIDWEVECDEGVVLKKIIAAGNLPQRVVKSPHGVDIELYSGRDGFAIHDARNLLGVERVSTRLSEITSGLKPDCVTAAHHLDGVLNVGPANGSQRLQLATRSLEKLLSELNQQSRLAALQRLESKRFHAIHRGILPRMPAAPNQDGRFWNEFSLRGPLIGQSVAVDTRTQFAARDENTGRLFLISNTNLNTTLTIRDLDRDQRETQQLGRRQVVGFAFVPETGRLVLDSTQGWTEFDFATKKLKTIRKKSNHLQAGLAWSRTRKVFYSAQVARSGQGEIRQIERYNAHGVALGPIELSKPFVRGRQYGPNSLQLIDLDDHLVMLDYRAQTASILVNGRHVRRPPVGQISVVDVETGEVVHSGRIEPVLEQQDISATELESIWEHLGIDGQCDDALLWKMAAGGTKTLEFLRPHYREVAPTMSEQEIESIVLRLDNNRFSIRAEAYEALQQAGSSIEPILRNRLTEGGLSSEVRERLQALVSKWETGQPQTDYERRLVRGLDVIGRMGSPESKQRLKELQGTSYDALIRSHAKSAGNPAVQVEEAQHPVIRFQQKLWVPRNAEVEVEVEEE